MKKTFCAALALLLTLCLSMCLLPSAWAEGESFSLGDEETFDASRGVIVNAENFPDSIFRAYVAENYDKEGDLVLTAEEYEAVTEMDVHGLGITSLDGVWFFPNLTVLNCSDNNLRELNVNDNPKLETLYCQGNFVWSETVGEGENAHTAYHGLEHLIPGRGLKVLWCFNNALTEESLNLDLCPDLEYLDCSNNPIGTLNLSPVPGLLELRCNDAGLAGIDLSTVPELCVLWCWNNYGNNSIAQNGLREIDVSPCSKLVNAVTNGAIEKYIYSTAFYNDEAELSVPTAFYQQFTIHLGGEYEDIVLDKDETDKDKDAIIVAIDEEHFPDAAFRSEVEKFDYNNDKALSKGELSQNYLSIYGMEIASLKGIEYFTELSSLDCGGNELTSIELSGFEKLTNLNISGNPTTKLVLKDCKAMRRLDVTNMDMLSSLSVSGCTELTSLNCSNNQLSSLSVSGCTELTSLNCSNNQLSGLDVSKCTKLATLNCSSNQLSDLNVSKCTKLTSLNCSSNQLTGLEVTGLGTLSCGNNHLDTLDVSGCPSLRTLSCGGNMLGTLDVRGNTELTSLSCSNTGISELDLSHNSALTYLICSSNNLSALDVSMCPLLESLNCSGNPIQKLDIAQNENLIKAFTQGEKNESETAVLYRYTFELDMTLTPYGMTPMSVSYALNMPKSTLLVSDPAESDHTGLFPDPSFRAYVMNNFDLDKNGSLSTGELKAVKEMDISGKGICDLTGIERFTELTVLNCSENKLTTLDVSGLKHLEELYCQGNYERLTADINGSMPEPYGISDTAVFDKPATGGGLTSLTVGSAPLKVLWCYDNSLRSLDLSSCRTLENLDCAFNFIESLNVTNQPNLTVLMCHDNDLNTLNLSANPSLTYLWAWNNPIEQIDISMCPKLVAACSGSIENFIDHVSIFNDEAEVSISQYTALYRGAVDSGVPINASTFPDRDFRAYVCVTADRNYDGVLSDAEIAALDMIDCSGWQIRSMEGVNYLTGLKSIKCRQNELTELDVSGIAGLEHLDCCYNQITSLNITGNTQLRHLLATGNSLTDLDLSTNGQLRVLWCWNNSLTGLDLRNCPILSSLAVNGLTENYGGEVIDSYYDDDGEYHETRTGDYICYYEKAGNGDLSIDTAVAENLITERFVEVSLVNFPDEAFYTFVKNAADSNGDALLSSAEISAVIELNCADMGIENLKGIELFTSLGKLDCSKNALVQLDLSTLASLEELNCSGNRLTKLDTSRNPALLVLNCSNNRLTETVFSNNYALRSLNCSGNLLKKLDIGNCDIICAFTLSGASPTIKNGIRTYSGTWHDELYGQINVYFASDSTAQLWTETYPEPDCVLPSDLQCVEAEAFTGCSFVCVKLADSVAEIGPRAFADSPNLRGIIIPLSVKTIDDSAFDNVTQLRIYGAAGSAAQRFAEKHNLAFVAID